MNRLWKIWTVIIPKFYILCVSDLAHLTNLVITKNPNVTWSIWAAHSLRMKARKESRSVKTMQFVRRHCRCHKQFSGLYWQMILHMAFKQLCVIPLMLMFFPRIIAHDYTHMFTYNIINHNWSSQTHIASIRSALLICVSRWYPLWADYFSVFQHCYIAPTHLSFP